MQTVRAITELVAVPPNHRKSLSEPAIVSAACHALVQLLAAGADGLVYAQNTSARENTVRLAVEKNPDSWKYVLLHARESVLTAATSENGGEFEAVWRNVSRLFRYAIIDPTVPAWAQGQACNTVLEIASDLAGGFSNKDAGMALTVLEWAIRTGSDMATHIPHAMEAVDTAVAAQCDIETVGRWDQCQWVVAYSRVIQTLSARLLSGGTIDHDSSGSSSSKLLQYTDQVRMALASLIFNESQSSFAAHRPFSPRIQHDTSTLVAVLARMTATAHALSADKQPSAKRSRRSRDCVTPDVVMWVLAVTQVAIAKTSAEQKGLLSIIDMIARNKPIVSGFPSEIVSLARFPLLCVAMDGFSQSICLQAYHLSVDADQIASPADVLDPQEIGRIQAALADLAATELVSGHLPLLFNSLCDYLSVYAGLYGQNAAGSRQSPLDSITKSVSAIADRPLLLAPLLFEWRLSGGGADPSASVSRLALAKLLSLLDARPRLRLSLLPLFMCALRHPDAPTKLRHVLILHGIPCLASTHDAYATSRVVSVVSSLWNHGKSRPDQQRLCCLAIRAWSNIVARNPRVWRDLKPVITQMVETKKASATKAHGRHVSGGGVDPEYEWAVLVTIRDLVAKEPDRYADQMLPLVFSLLSYAQESLSASSTALLIDAANICVESRMAGVRSVWTAILSKTAKHWFKRAGEADSGARPVLEALARFCGLVATHGEDSDTYAAFRQEILAQYVLPQCGLPKQDSGGVLELAPGGLAPPAVALEPRTRDLYLSALSSYPMEEVLPLVSGSTPSQTVDALLALLSHQQSTGPLVERINKSGSMSDLLAVLMDNEVKFMRRSLISGSSASAKAAIDDEDAGGVPGLGQRQLWARSNFERSQWLNDVLMPAVSKIGELYKGSSARSDALASGYALAAMVGPSHASPEADAAGRDEAPDNVSSGMDVQNQPADLQGGARVSAESRADKFVVQLSSLLADVSLADHWCIRNSATDAWSIWFATAFREIQGALLGSDKEDVGSSISAADGLAAISAAGHRFVLTLQESLRTSHVPAHMVNALHAFVGLVRTASAQDQHLGSELSMLVGGIVVDTSTLPYAASPADFWPSAAGTYNEGVLAAAVECAGQIAISGSDDMATLSQITQFLMGGLTLSVDGLCDLPPLVVQAIARALMYLHPVFAKQKQQNTKHSDDVVAVEADDIRRCVERLGVLHSPAPGPGARSNVSMSADVGSVGVAMSLATMHRHWISQLINPALAEQNSSPRAAQAMRVIAQTLAVAYESLALVEEEQWSQRAVSSLFYLCFVWPPRPITQRHLELHRGLFTVTPERVWLTATRLVRKLWASLGEKQLAGDAAAGSPQMDVLNFVEVAYSTLAYHLAMTTSRSTAHSAHAKLVRQYAATVKGDMGELALAATEKPSLRANRIVSLAILLGIPMHGVPETTVSNEYLPAEQQKNLPVLLGIGSVQYGSTAWLRLPEQTLQEPLEALLSCSGLLQYVTQDSTSGDSVRDGSEQTDTKQAVSAKDMARAVEIDDVRAARIASVVLGGLWSQSSRAMHLLLIDEHEDQIEGTSGSTAAGGDEQKPQSSAGSGPAAKSASDLAGGSSVQAYADTARAADEEPKNLSRLPAPTSWTRAVWESISELAESLVTANGDIVETVECRLAYLLLAMYKIARPFPLVDSRKVFARIIAAYVDGPGSTNLPLLALGVRVASKLSPTSCSMNEVLVDALLKIVARATDIAASTPVSEQYSEREAADSLLALALECLGDTGLGRVLHLSGLTSAQDDGAGNSGATRDARAVLAVGTDALGVQAELDAAISQTLPASLEKSGAAAAGTFVPQGYMAESEAERMFRIMSKVSIPAAKVTNLCASIIGKLFAGGVLSGNLDSPVLFSLRSRVLATLQNHIAYKGAAGVSQEVTVGVAREKIASSLLSLLGADGTAEPSVRISTCSELEMLSWQLLGATCCGDIVENGQAILSRQTSGLGAASYCSLVEQQSLVLQRWICQSAAGANSADCRLLAGKKTWMTMDVKGVVGDWLKRTFKEWARRCRQQACLEPDALRASVAWSLRSVAEAMCATHRRRTDSGVLAVGDAEGRRWTVQALDMAILASSIACAGSSSGSGDDKGVPGFVDQALAVSCVSWLLPLLTGLHPHCVSAATGVVGDSDMLLGIATGEIQEYIVDLDSKSSAARGRIGKAAAAAPELSGQQQQYPAQLRSRLTGLLDLAQSPLTRRALRLVLSNLAILGMLPSSDLQRIV
ncbi:hypothetical protein GQ54DRAFT_296724 [Martensiomyces pterosporus]|nr:hypothetical protein GQ54DRAFT_296724 [Martensiomyces pterosporus]